VIYKILLAIVFSLTSASCGVVEQEKPDAPVVPPPVPGNEDGGLGGGEKNEFHVSIINPVDQGGSSAFIVTSSFVDPNSNGTVLTKTGCNVAPGAANKDIYCIVHLEEHDLFTHGVEMKFNFPKEMCDYGVRQSSWFYNFEPGIGPNVITYDTENGGSPTNVVILGSGAAGSSVNGDGTATCAFDHSLKPGGSNCCVGKYTITSTDSTPDPLGGAPVISVTTTEGDWGGTFGACVGGHALDDGSPRYGHEFLDVPIGESFPVIGEALDIPYKVLPLSERSNGTSLHGANFFYTPTPNDSTSWPDAFQIPPSGPQISLVSGQPYLELHCTDRSLDINARIRIMVQGWSTATEFAKFRSNTGLLANPDIAGDELGFPNDPSYPFRDYLDWAFSLIGYPELSR
jgi:hypothetical protein